MSVEERLTDAKNQFKDKSYKQAIDIYYSCVEDVVGRNDRLLTSTLYMNIALCLVAQGKLHEGEEQFKRHSVISDWLSKSLAFNSSNVKALYQRAKIFEEMNLFQMAYEDCERILNITQNEKERSAVRKYLRSLSQRAFDSYHRRVTGMKDGIATKFSNLHLAKLRNLMRQSIHDSPDAHNKRVHLSKSKYLYVVTHTSDDYSFVDYISADLHTAYNYFRSRNKRIIRWRSTYLHSGPTYPSIESSSHYSIYAAPALGSTVFSSVFINPSDSCTIEQCDNPFYIPYEIHRMKSFSDVDIIVANEPDLSNRRRKRIKRNFSNEFVQVWVLYSKHKTLLVPQVLGVFGNRMQAEEAMFKDITNYKHLTGGSLAISYNPDTMYRVRYPAGEIIWYLDEVNLQRKKGYIQRPRKLASWRAA